LRVPINIALAPVVGLSASIFLFIVSSFGRGEAFF
jgi:hypothetical protein